MTLAEKIAELQRKVGVVATSAVTLLSGLAVLITTFSSDIATVAPEGYADDVTKWAVVVVAWITTAVAALRRVTPVHPDDRGILMPPVTPVDESTA